MTTLRTMVWLAFVLVVGVGRPASAASITIAPDSLFGFIPLSTFGVSAQPSAVNDGVLTVATPSFVYAGETWNSIGFASNGFLIVGGGTDGTSVNQSLPSPTGPNNVLAPFWADLTLGELRVQVLTDGVKDWLVFDWADMNGIFDFQVWIGLNGVEDITFAYNPQISWTSLPASLTIGAEDKTGTVGAMWHFNGTGSSVGQDLRVSTDGLPVATAVPEPATLFLVGGGLGTAWLRKHRRQRR